FVCYRPVTMTCMRINDAGLVPGGPHAPTLRLRHSPPPHAAAPRCPRRSRPHRDRRRHAGEPDLALPRCCNGRITMTTRARSWRQPGLLAAGTALALVAACGSGDPLADPDDSGADSGSGGAESTVGGSQTYYSSE